MRFARSILALLLLGCVSVPANAGTPAEEAFERFRGGTLDIQTLAEVLPRLADAELRPLIRAKIIESETPPRAEMVALLDHPALAVRLGALELLEELAGGDLSYNPWVPAGSPENTAALVRWKAWAGEANGQARSGPLFSDDQRRAYLQDLLGGDADKAARARRMLEAEGLPAVGFLEIFLQETPTLPSGGRARVREAQYQIVLSRQLGEQAAVTARHLAFGSRDQMLAAIDAIRGAGLPGIPILRDFITHPDPLVRETAIDALLVVGGEQAVAVVAPLLEAEPDVNVIHGTLRRLKDIKCSESQTLVTSFLSHPDEDLMVSAIQTSFILSGDRELRLSFEDLPKNEASPQADTAILKCLADPRWRIRSAALEYVTRRKVSAAKEQCLALLHDADDFVRFAAIKAVVALSSKDTLPKLKQMLLDDDSMIGPVIEGYGAMKETLDDEILARLDAAPPEARLAAIRAAESNESLRPLLLRYAADADPDVACAALRAISANDDCLKRNSYASAVVIALRSGDAAKTAAILERLDLPVSSRGRIDPMLMETVASVVKSSRTSTALDPLYEAFMLPGTKGTGMAPDDAHEIPGAQAELIREISRLTAPEQPAEPRFNAALNLARTGNKTGYQCLIRDLPTFTTAQKILICDRLYSPSKAEAAVLLKSLLRDPVSEVRSQAAECALSNEKARALVGMVLAELEDPDGKLQPHECYGYRFDYACRGNIALFRPWCLRILESETATTPLRVLAAAASRHCGNVQINSALRKHAAAGDAVMRRAAWHALLSARPAELSARAEAIAADPEAFVRAVLPDRAAKTKNQWQHHFSDATTIRDSYTNYSEKSRRIDDATRAILARLAVRDPSPLIRFEASFSLLAQGTPIDFEAFVLLVPRLSKETSAVERITKWLGENASRATPALRPLLAVINPAKIQPAKLKTLNSRIRPEGAGGMPTFASLAANGDDPVTDPAAPVLEEEVIPDAPARDSLRVVFFYKPGCAECNRAREYINSLKTDFPLLEPSEHNILESSGLLFNQSLCTLLDVPSAKHSVAPAVFTQAGFVIGPDISPAELGKLFAATMTTPQDDGWLGVAETEKATAAAAVDRRYESITLPIVLIGGLLDGINPCAFATIIFFLSYLQIARRTPREMLMVGAAFISAVFLAYLAAGLLLHELLDTVNQRFAGIQRWMNFGFGGLALVAAWLSLRDALRARAGRLDEMTLQLPGLLKERIRGVIRSGARARNFVIAAFVSGLVISLLELACTGQVYAPIIYQIQKGRLDAVLWLVIYNLAFIAPLVVIFLLAYGGLRSEKLIDFQKKHTFAVKLGLAVVFLLLALLILTSGGWLAR